MKRKPAKKHAVLSPLMEKAVTEQQRRVFHLAAMIHAMDLASEAATDRDPFDIQAALAGIRSMADDIADQLDSVSLEKRATALADGAACAEGQS